MTDVVVTDQAFGGVARERSLAEEQGLTFAEHALREADESAVAAAVRGARVVFNNFAPITEPVLEALGDRAVVIRYGIGFDNVDITSARRHGVRVCNVPDYGVSTVADHTVALLLMLLRRLGPFDARLRAGGWYAPGELGGIPGFAESTIGLIGSGRIGRAVLERLRPFEFAFRVHDPYLSPSDIDALGATPSSLEEVLSESHAVSVHVPLSAGTRHLIDGDALERMRPGAFLVNTARGGLVDEVALAAAVRSGRIGGAALDVFEQEPIPADSELLRLPQVVLTPHAAFFSDASLAALQRLATEEAARALAGQPLRCEVT